VPSKIHQYNIGKDNLYCFYRFIVLPWELEWSDKKFLVSQGTLQNYCTDHRINIKSFSSVDKLIQAIESKYEIEQKNVNGILWFVRQESKAKDTLRHLRNCFAHGNYKKDRKIEHHAFL